MTETLLNEPDELIIRPGVGWTNFDGTITVENKGDKTIFVTIKEAESANAKTTRLPHD